MTVSTRSPVRWLASPMSVIASAAEQLQVSMTTPRACSKAAWPTSCPKSGGTAPDGTPHCWMEGRAGVMSDVTHQDHNTAVDAANAVIAARLALYDCLIGAG